MNTCAVCDDLFPNDHPAHHIILEIEDRTRSTKQFMGDETNIKRLCLDRELCGECWRKYSTLLNR
jgi:hypothetical protein